MYRFAHVDLSETMLSPALEGMLYDVFSLVQVCDARVYFMMKPSVGIEDILKLGGALARSLKGFEFRNSQMQMARLIQEALQKKVPAIVEAGTGTGKTFGYLVPLILSGKKVVISTGTKNLQEQIYFKDLPLLQRAANLNIDTMIMKGRKNYLCLHRYHHYFSQSSFLKPGMGKAKQRLDTWLKKTTFADRSELSWLADEDALWDSLSSTSDQCLGSECMYLDECFLARLRSRAAKAKIIIVNHYLFFADLKVKKSGFGEVIPRFQVAVFDEAHIVEEIATSYLGETLSTSQLMELVNDLEKEIRDLQDIDRRKLRQHVDVIKAGSENLRTLLDSQGDKGRLDQKALSVLRKGPANEIHRGLKYLKEIENFHKPDHPMLQAMAARATDMDDILDQILKKRNSNWLNWFEKRKRSLVLHASPLDISERMNELLYNKVQTVVFTSATLSTNKTFDYIRSRLGLPEDTIEGSYPSHFDFKTQTLMYIPKDLPSPNSPDFVYKAANRVAGILERTHGRALILFTSYHNLNLVFQILDGSMPYALYKQGDAPRSALLEAFRTDIHSVLFATASFWQGVDVPGEALSCLIIDKLPFDPPADPLVAARIDAIREKGGNPFMEYQVPSAIISLKQGLGRLIRKNSDRGILSVLDIRLVTTRYGRFFLDSLPDVPISHDLSDIACFFQ